MKIHTPLICFCIVFNLQAQDDQLQIKLKDFKPQSIYKTPRTIVEKAAHPVIDMHSHHYAKSIAELDQWVENMDAAGIQKSIVMTYAHGPQFDSLINAYSRYKDRFDLWCGFDYSDYESPDFAKNAIQELDRCYNLGAKGVGELGDMVPLFSRCAELDIPINIHVADPIWMYEKMDATNDGLMNALTWRLDNQEGIVDHPGMIRILENTMKKNSKTTFIACHLANCSYDLSIVGDLLDRYSNFFIDIAARYSEIAPTPRTTKAFMIKYQDRIVYGTDMGFDLDMYHTTFRILESADEHFYDHELFSYHWALNGLDLPDEVLKKIYFTNAKSILSK
jgi:predicted TIM-barrel fold metal-dependent hydrolase